jgi:hypothetical protein
MVLGEVQLGPGGEVLRARSGKKGRKKERRGSSKENAAGAGNRKAQAELDAEDFLQVIRKKTAQCSVMTPARKAPAVAPAPRRTPREQPGLPCTEEPKQEPSGTPSSRPATPVVHKPESADVAVEELIDETGPTLEPESGSAFLYKALNEEVASVPTANVAGELATTGDVADVAGEAAVCADSAPLEPDQPVVATKLFVAEHASVLTFNAWLDDCAGEEATPAAETHHAVRPDEAEESNKVQEAALRLVSVMTSLPERESVMLPARLNQVYDGTLRLMHVIEHTELPASLVKAHDAAMHLADSVSQQLEARLPEMPLAPAVSRWDWAIVCTSLVLALV